MAAGEIPIGQIESGDSVFYDGSIRVVRGRIKVSHPSRTILLTEDGRSISLTDGTLIERVSTDLPITAYAGPKWVCGMPEKAEINSLDPGDLVLEPNAELVSGRIKTANGYVLITTELGDPSMTHVRVYRSSDRIRLLATGIVRAPGIGVSSVDKIATEVAVADLEAPIEIILEGGAVEVVEITRSGENITLRLADESSIARTMTDSVISLQPIPPAEPSALASGGQSIEFRCANGHVTTVAQALDGDKRFIDCPNCGLPATTPSPSPATRYVPSSEVPGPPIAKFCGNCGRARKPDNVFCTGCGNRISKLDTTGFSS